jgi:hypothetical protein
MPAVPSADGPAETTVASQHGQAMAKKKGHGKQKLNGRCIAVIYDAGKENCSK